MSLGNISRIRLGVGITVLAAVLALVIAIAGIGLNSDSQSVEAGGPTPKPVGNGQLSGVSDVVVDSLGNSALELEDGIGLFYCIASTDHVVIASAPDTLKTSLQCNIDAPGQGDPAPGSDVLVPPSLSDINCAGLAGPALTACLESFPRDIKCQPLLGQALLDCLSPRTEPGADLLVGPPPPPPYTTLSPSKGFGYLYETADGQAIPAVCVAVGAAISAGTINDCSITSTCFEQVGAPYEKGGNPGDGGIGPFLISKAIIINPITPANGVSVGGAGPYAGATIDMVASGGTQIWYNQTSLTCADANLQLMSVDGNVANQPFGSQIVTVADPLGLRSITAYDGSLTTNANAAPWRLAAAGTILDFDGDGCRDDQELDKSYIPPGSGVKCGDDPQNPFDSFDATTVDLSGAYDLTVMIIPSNCKVDPCDTNNATGGIFAYCRADLKHFDNTTVTIRPFCYFDSPGTQVNSQAYPGITGDGFAGGPPPGKANNYPCGTFTGPPLVGSPCNYAWGDLDDVQTSFTATFNKTTNMLSVSGCFQDRDGSGSLGDVWVVADVSAHMIPGSVTLYAFSGDEDPDDGLFCENTTGAGINDPGCSDPNNPPFPPDCEIGTVVFPKGEITLTKQPQGKTRDGDRDGVPDANEVQDDSVCGLRDPYNPNDFYDVSIPRDGKIDLFTDIAGVIANYAPFGYNTSQPALSGAPGTMENFDRPPAMSGGAGWNYGSPDGKIDLFNDIAGVISMYTPFGCPIVPQP